MYIIWDIQQKKQVGTQYQSAMRARTRADKLDNVYGAHRYIAIPTQAAFNRVTQAEENGL